jgi:hypothetical protein
MKNITFLTEKNFKQKYFLYCKDCKFAVNSFSAIKQTEKREKVIIIKEVEKCVK